MKRWLLFLVICCVGLTAAGSPPGASFGRSSAMILLPPRGTRIDIMSGPFGTAARVERVVTSRIEAAVSSRPGDLFDLAVKIVLVKDLVPLFVAMTLATDGIGVLSTLFFGPVQIDWGRAWGVETCRWASVQLSARSRLSMFVGVDADKTPVEPFAGVRVFPGGHGLWEIGISVGRDGIRLSAGGVL
jgi:hypothetical protein